MKTQIKTAYINEKARYKGTNEKILKNTYANGTKQV